MSDFIRLSLVIELTKCWSFDCVRSSSIEFDYRTVRVATPERAQGKRVIPRKCAIIIRCLISLGEGRAKVKLKGWIWGLNTVKVEIIQL